MSKRKADDFNKSELEEPEKKSQKLAPLFCQASTKQVGSWKVFADELMIFTPGKIEHRNKIAAFDMDGTLIKTKSGNVFPKDTNDWQFWNHKVPIELKALYKDGFKICIFSNQKGLQNKKAKITIADFQTKIKRICDVIDLPIQVFISLGTANYRKPYSGMWDHLVTSENGQISVQVDQSFFCGDAAGRVETPLREKADHSSADRLFAMNCSLRFLTPEEFFLKESAKEPFKLPQFSPRELISNPPSDLFNPSNSIFPGPSQELLVLIGAPASGKSTFSKMLNTMGDTAYTVVNQDELHTRQKCLDQVRKHLLANKSVIVDNTNRDKKTRSEYCALAKSLNLPCRCLLFNCSNDQAAHNNKFRQIIGTDSKHKHVNDFVIRTFFAAYEEPKLEEGYQAIVKVNFIPRFESDRERAIYSQYLLEH